MTTERKERHGCLTIQLILMIVASLYSALINLGAWVLPVPEFLATKVWALPILAVSSLLGVVFAIALFRWKKWGFWGFVAVASFNFILNLILGLGIVASLPGLLGIALLYGVLHIGATNAGWPQLE